VITHAPHGNERSHLQHIQCFRYVRRWCRAKKLPLGFFSEKPIPQLEVRGTGVRIHNRVTFQEVRFRSTPLVKELADAFAATPLNMGGYLRLVRTKFRMAQELGPIRSLFVIDITANKQSLLATYASQIEGLKQYETYHHRHEYLYLAGQQTARRLIPYLQCLSY
jgi:LmbE family N-acetylglucosaminyl deacetylase